MFTASRDMCSLFPYLVLVWKSNDGLIAARFLSTCLHDFCVVVAIMRCDSALTGWLLAKFWMHYAMPWSWIPILIHCLLGYHYMCISYVFVLCHLPDMLCHVNTVHSMQYRYGVNAIVLLSIFQQPHAIYIVIDLTWLDIDTVACCVHGDWTTTCTYIEATTCYVLWHNAYASCMLNAYTFDI